MPSLTPPETRGDRAAVTPRGITAVSQANSSLTLVEGTTFCVSGPDGEIDPHRAHGLFFHDTRVISRWQLTIDGQPLDPLTAIAEDPYRGVIMSRGLPRGDLPEGTVIVERTRLVASGMREDIRVRNFGPEAAAIDLALDVDADFADLFEVKDHRLGPKKQVGRVFSDSQVEFWIEDTSRRSVSISSPQAKATNQGLVFRIVVQPRSEWRTTVKVFASVDGVEIVESFPPGQPLASARPAVRMKDWLALAPGITVQSVVLQSALDQSQRDLGALRITDSEHPDDDVVAAGAPWFMALFGRDSLITSHFMLPFAPQLAVGTLRTLARLQGTKLDARTEEEPGRILHEVRYGETPALGFAGDKVYFGSVDSTPLFVQLCGSAVHWGTITDDQLLELQPAIRRALDWIVSYGDRDADGLIEYQRTSDRGLQNQGWKDSQDSMAFSDGRRAMSPISLAEVQGYCYAAYVTGGDLEDRWGDRAAAAKWRQRAERLKAAFHERFWMPDLDFYAMALDRDKTPLDVVSSNVGHVLWTGLADEAVVPKIVERLLSPEMFTGFGIRTLSSEAASFNPASYHNGSIWPHDTTITAAGMVRYGHRDAAATVSSGLIDALEAFGGRLPELFCGFTRADQPWPVPYPTSCMPQAWAAASPYELLRLNLNLQWDPMGRSLLAESTPDFIGEVDLENLRIHGHRTSVHADPAGTRVTTSRG